MAVRCPRIADLVVLEHDPIADVENLRSVSLVVKDGHLVDRGALSTRPVPTVAAAPTSTTGGNP